MSTLNMRRVQKLIAHCNPSSTTTHSSSPQSPIQSTECTKEDNTFSQQYGSRMLHVIDCHAAGEPARIIVGGLPHIPGNAVEEKRKYMMNHLDDIRLFLLQEPRGYPCQNANAIVSPSRGSPAKYGFIIMEQNKIYPAMSGHNTICVATALLETGMVPMIPDDEDDDSIGDDGSFETTFMLEAPAGLIQIKALCRGRKAVQITLTNTVSFMDPKYKNILVKLPMSIPSILGRSLETKMRSNVDEEKMNIVSIDIAYGGMWYCDDCGMNPRTCCYLLVSRCSECSPVFISCLLHFAKTFLKTLEVELGSILPVFQRFLAFHV